MKLPNDFWFIFSSVATGIGALATSLMFFATYRSLRINKKQAEAEISKINEQIKAGISQNLEIEFNNRLNSLLKIKENVHCFLEYGEEKTKITGDDAFLSAYNSYYLFKKQLTTYTNEFLLERNKKYLKHDFFYSCLANFRNYYSSLISILMFCQENGINQKYSDRVFNSLENGERKFLALFCKCCEGDESILFSELLNLIRFKPDDYLEQ